MEISKKQKIGKRKPINKWAVAFIIVGLFPTISHLLIFWAGVQLTGLVQSFQEYPTNEFTFSNYVRAIRWFFDSSSVLGQGLINTTKFFVTGLVGIFLAMYAAYMLYKKMAGSRFVRTTLYLPSAISGYMLVTLYMQILTSNGAVMSFLNGVLHLNIPTPLIVEEAMGMMIFYMLWSSLGGGLIVWFGAMGRIPEDLIEYGRLEGIGAVGEFFKVIVPLIWPTFVTIITLNCVGFFGSDGPVFLFTQGKYGTTTIGYWLFEIVYNGDVSNYGFAMSVGWVLTFATVPLVVIGRWVTRRFGQEVEY